MKLHFVTGGGPDACREETGQGCDVLVFGVSALGEVDYRSELDGTSQKLESLALLSRRLNCVAVAGCVTLSCGFRRRSAVVAERGKLLGVSDQLYTQGEQLHCGAHLKVYPTAAGKLGRQTSDYLNQRASEIFSELTEGKYRRLQVNERFEISVWDGTRYIRTEQLSRGTLEQIYFSIRMSAAELLQEEPMPVILDDTFAFYDEKRLESVLKWLSRQERQVIIFTCHKREEEILRIF